MVGGRRTGVRWLGPPDGHGQQGGGGGGGPTSAPRQGEGVLDLGLGVGVVGSPVAGDGGSSGDAVAGADGGQLVGEQTLDSEQEVAEDRSEQDAVFSGMQGRLERLEREFESLKDFVRAGQEEVRRDVEK